MADQKNDQNTLNQGFNMMKKVNFRNPTFAQTILNLVKQSLLTPQAMISKNQLHKGPSVKN